jgi:hypothetical protein
MRVSAVTSDSGGIAIHRSRVESQVGVREVYEQLLGSVVRRGETETVGYTVENPCRGIYTGGEVVIESRAPFEHFYGRRSTPAASDTVVYPRTFDVAGLPPSAVTGAEWGEEAAGPVATATGTLMRGVARLDPASITLVGLLVGGAYLVFFYTRKFVAYRSRETLVVRAIKVSNARLYTGTRRSRPHSKRSVSSANPTRPWSNTPAGRRTGCTNPV